MPSQMSEQELEVAMEQAKKVDDCAWRSDEDEENYVLADLFKDHVGHFRVVTQSGMHSVYHGAGNVGERLTSAELKNWCVFD